MHDIVEKMASKLCAISPVNFFGGLEKIRDFLQSLSEKYFLYCQILQNCFFFLKLLQHRQHR